MTSTASELLSISVLIAYFINLLVLVTVFCTVTFTFTGFVSPLIWMFPIVLILHAAFLLGFVNEDRKGIAFPGLALPIDPLTEKDLADLEVGFSMDVDYIALSFVRGRHDMEELRHRVDAAGCRAGLIAKLERPEALKDLHGILEASDGVMVARGDLGIEMAPEEVPLAQKRIIREATRAGKYVITATQMLESMIHNHRPTRAEVSDVANALLDGADAVMLSAETAVGAYPVQAVRTMAVISQGMAPSLNYRPVSGGFGPLPAEPAVAAPLQNRQRRQQFVL